MNYTIDDIAKELGMSKTTVSRAISGKGRISDATREKVMAFIKEVNYAPSAVARSLAASRTNNIGLVVPRDSELDEMPYFQNVMTGVCEAASDYGYDVLMILADNDDISSLQRAVTNKKVDGVMVSRCMKGSRVLEYLKEVQFPSIVLGNPLDEEILYIDNDNQGAAARMTENLLDRGFKKMALIGGNDNLFVTQSRLQGYLDAFKNREVEVNSNMIFMNMQRRDRLEFVIREILENEVDCIVCMDDVLCNSTLLYLQKHGVNVPQDVKLVSFYDSNLLSNHKPSITSLYFDSKHLGAEGLSLLLRNIEDGVAQSRVIGDYNIQMRDSTRD